MLARTEYKFVTTRLLQLTPSPHDPSYVNWSEVSDMLTRYGAEGWRVVKVSGTKLGEEAVIYAFVLERVTGAPAQKRTR